MTWSTLPTRQEINDSLKAFADAVHAQMKDGAELQMKTLESLRQSTEQKLEAVRESVERQLHRIQEDSTKKLEQMRETVDEKLHATLERRFGEVFKMVSEQLDRVQKGLGEMRSIATGVGDLKKVLSNVKTRGIFGEAQLATLLEEILTPGQFDRNVKTKKGSGDTVEFAIKFPGPSEDIQQVWLPIDAKFPLEDYQKLVEAQERGDVESIIQLGKALEAIIKSGAKDIRDKYIDPPHTTDFGLLYLPYESLYAEVLRRAGLVEHIRQHYRVAITGPTTTQAFLNSLQMGFRTISIQKRSSEVWALLGSVKTEFGKFWAILEKTHKKLQEASNTIEDAAKKSRTIESKLRNVADLPPAEATALLASPLGVPDEDTIAPAT